MLNRKTAHVGSTAPQPVTPVAKPRADHEARADFDHASNVTLSLRTAAKASGAVPIPLTGQSNPAPLPKP
jgi:hypothetical protein